MPIDIVNYLKDKLKSSNPSIDVSEGSGVYDLLISPLSFVLSKYDTTLSNLIEKFSKFDISKLNDEEIKSLALNFLITPREGNKATGNIKFYYAEPNTVIIPNGTIVKYGDLKFEVIGNFTIPKSSLTYNNSYYVTPDIPILALSYGSEYNLPSNSTFYLEGFSTKNPVNIISSGPITGGSDSESPEELLDRLKFSLFGQFLSSPVVIEKYLKSIQPSIKNVDIVGYGNPIMLRDIVYDFSKTGDYNKADYLYVRPGTAEPGKDKLHKAYYGEFSDTNSGSGVGFPTSPSAWSLEFTETMYKGLYSKSDLDYAKTFEVELLKYFTSSSNLPVSGTGDNSQLTLDGWYLKDGISRDNEIVRYGDIAVVDGALRLGQTIYTEDEINLVKEAIKELKSEIETNNVYTKSELAKAKEKLENLIKLLSVMVEGNVMNHNPSPVVTKQLDTHTGIKIEIDLATTDNSDEGNLSYITVFKNNLIMTPYDGYGVAWKKQPEYLIRLDKNEYPSEDDQQLKDDLKLFYNEYKLDGQDFRGKISGTRGTIHPDAESKIWKYNVYIVDNNLLEDEVWVSSQQIWNQASGRDQFLAAGKIWIEHDVEYHLRVDINEDMGIKAWIDPDVNSTPVVSFGPTTPTYIPDANADITVGSNTAQRNHFGLGVINTQNYEWYYKNLVITPIQNVFPGHLFKLDVSNFNPSQGINYYYSGMAFENGVEDSGQSSVQLAIYNFNSSTWEVLGTSTVTLPNALNPYVYEDNLISNTISSGNGAGVSITNLTNYISNDYVYFAAMPTDDTIDIHELRSYYFEINDGEYAGVNRGNAVDVYVNDPDNITIGYMEEIISNKEINLKSNAAANEYIHEVLDISEAYSNISINRSDWAIFIDVRERGEAYSNINNFKIVFSSDSYNGTKVKVKYTYWKDGVKVNGYLQDSDVRQPAVDYMLKVIPPTVVTINLLNYSGNLSEDKVKTELADFINSLNSRTLEKSDLVNKLYDIGATYVDLDMDISLRSYDSEMKVTNISIDGQSYTIPSNIMSRYYTNKDELYGVTKL